MNKSEKDPIIYHLDCYDDVLSKSSKNNKLTYPNSTKWMWGNVVTNKKRRTLNKYAIMMCPNGKKAHYVNRDTFIRFFSDNFKHVYVKEDIQELIKLSKVENFIKLLDEFTPQQRSELYIRVINKLVGCN